jgi:hypothetical protein
MNEAMKNMLIGIAQSKIFLMQLSADSLAMMTAMSVLVPGMKQELDQQRAIEHDRIRGLIEEQNLMIQALQSGVSPLQN